MSLILLLAVASAQPTVVRPGVEVLATDSIGLVKGRRVGLVTNYAAVGRDGRSAVDILLGAGVRLTALFSPEHGFRGAADPGEAVASSVDSATGLPIYSLYGRTSQPTPEMLADVDVIAVDLPDVGARYYTYLHTTIEVMRAAARAGKRVLVLDRPNPIGGQVQGIILDSAYRSGVGALAMPIRHGLSLGEQALLARLELGLTADLLVVPAAGWRRRDDQYVTHLPFLPPSPNLKDIESLFHYPGTCLFEGTALSVGRGTDFPFHQIGAPWLDTTAVLAIVRKAGLKGVRFVSTTFRPVAPGDAKHPDVLLAGIRLVMTDRNRYDPVLTAIALLDAVQRVHPDRIGFRNSGFDRLAGGPAIREAVQAGRKPAAIVASWKGGINAFKARSRPFLLYR
ncbi:MAG: exo-beta-N-acetylmuramidase NamZ domain-containing protein [Gemmatimonadales bacterium]